LRAISLLSPFRSGRSVATEALFVQRRSASLNGVHDSDEPVQIALFLCPRKVGRSSAQQESC